MLFTAHARQKGEPVGLLAGVTTGLIGVVRALATKCANTRAAERAVV
jgi:hypothetical protein